MFDAQAALTTHTENLTVPIVGIDAFDVVGLGDHRVRRGPPRGMESVCGASGGAKAAKALKGLGWLPAELENL